MLIKVYKSKMFKFSHKKIDKKIKKSNYFYIILNEMLNIQKMKWQKIFIY
jgi:hypothetical protein